MHILQPKHIKLKPEEVEKIEKKYNISLSQLPKIKKDDVCVPESCEKGDVLKIERKNDESELNIYFRVVA